MRFQPYTKLKFVAGFVIALACGIGIVGAQGLLSITSQSLPINKIVQAAARTNQNAYTYFFDTDGSGTYYLLIDSTTLQGGPSFVVQDLTTNETVGIFRTSVTGACLQLDAAPGRYQLTVTAGTTAEQQDYHLMLWQENETQLDCPISKLTGKQNVVADGASPWEATTKGLQSVNLRVAPSVNSSVVTVLDPNIPASIVGTTEDGKWLALKVGETTAWVSADVVSGPNGGWRGLPVMDVPNYVPNVVNNINNSGSGESVVSVGGSTQMVNAANNTQINIPVTDNNTNNNGSTGGNNGNNGGSNNNTGNNNNGGSNGGNGGTTTNPTSVPATPEPATPVPPPPVDNGQSNTVDANVSIGGANVSVSVNAPIVDNTLNAVTCVAGSLLGGSC